MSISLPAAPRTQPAYGDWLVKAMVHCSVTTVLLAEMLSISNSAIYRWRNSNRRHRKCPSAASRKLIEFSLKAIWPRDAKGDFLPLPSKKPEPEPEPKPALAPQPEFRREAQIIEELKKINEQLQELTRAILE